MNQKGFGVLFLLVILGLVIIAGGIFYVVYYSMPHPQTSVNYRPGDIYNSPQSNSTSSASSSAESTANWKLYLPTPSQFRDGFGYSIKYPENWYVTMNNPNNSSDVPYVVFSQNPLDAVTAEKTACVGIYSSSFSSLEDAINQEMSIQISSQSPSQLYTVLSKSNINIISGNLKAIRLVVKRSDETDSRTQVYIDGGTLPSAQATIVYRIESCPNTDPQIFNKMLDYFAVQAN